MQKIQTRVKHSISRSYKELSTRRVVTGSIKTLQTTEVYVGLDHFKNLPNTDFRRLLEISNSVLNPKTGILWLNKKLVKESSYWDIRDLQKWEPRACFPKKLSGTYSFLPDNGFFHFLIEDLPRYLEVNNFAQDLVTIAGSSSRYITNALSIVKPNNYITCQIPVQVERLILSEKISGQVFSKSDLNLVRDTFSIYIKSNQYKSVFVSRRDKPGNKFISRGIDKRSQIEEIFTNFGFEIVFLEDLNLIDQIELMSSSKRIAGFHGAGLANIIWASHAQIIEISNTRLTRHFEHLSKICSHEYNFYSNSQPISDLHTTIKKY